MFPGTFWIHNFIFARLLPCFLEQERRFGEITKSTSHQQKYLAVGSAAWRYRKWLFWPKRVSYSIARGPWETTIIVLLSVRKDRARTCKPWHKGNQAGEWALGWEGDEEMAFTTLMKSWRWQPGGTYSSRNKSAGADSLLLSTSMLVITHQSKGRGEKLPRDMLDHRVFATRWQKSSWKCRQTLLRGCLECSVSSGWVVWLRNERLGQLFSTVPCWVRRRGPVALQVWEPSGRGHQDTQPGSKDLQRPQNS